MEPRRSQRAIAGPVDYTHVRVWQRGLGDFQLKKDFIGLRQEDIEENGEGEESPRAAAARSRPAGRRRARARGQRRQQAKEAAAAEEDSEALDLEQVLRDKEECCLTWGPMVPDRCAASHRSHVPCPLQRARLHATCPLQHARLHVACPLQRTGKRCAPLQRASTDVAGAEQAPPGRGRAPSPALSMPNWCLLSSSTYLLGCLSPQARHPRCAEEIQGGLLLPISHAGGGRGCGGRQWDGPQRPCQSVQQRRGGRLGQQRPRQPRRQQQRGSTQRGGSGRGGRAQSSGSRRAQAPGGDLQRGRHCPGGLGQEPGGPGACHRVPYLCAVRGERGVLGGCWVQPLRGT